MKRKYICIHGHFYQPPRENPWLEDIEIQESAHPFHDWNDRITYECYKPNSQARLLDHEGHRFMEGVHPLADLAPRDVVVNEMVRVMKEQEEDHLFLDWVPV